MSFVPVHIDPLSLSDIHCPSTLMGGVGRRQKLMGNKHTTNIVSILIFMKIQPLVNASRKKNHSDGLRYTLRNVA